MHCGLCISSCPTYLTSGLEAKSPRGRLMIMNQIQNNPKLIDEEMRYHLDTCLDCRGCETVCPSGVEYNSAFHETNKFINSNSNKSILSNFILKGIKKREYLKILSWLILIGKRIKILPL